MADLNYKGFVGTIDFHPEECIFYGQVKLQRDAVTYEAATLGSLEQEFRTSVDNYLLDCAGLGIDPL